MYVALYRRICNREFYRCFAHKKNPDPNFCIQVILFQAHIVEWAGECNSLDCEVAVAVLRLHIIYGARRTTKHVNMMKQLVQHRHECS